MTGKVRQQPVHQSLQYRTLRRALRDLIEQMHQEQCYPKDRDIFDRAEREMQRAYGQRQ